jgi:hypothetical protein
MKINFIFNKNYLLYMPAAFSHVYENRKTNKVSYRELEREREREIVTKENINEKK